MSIREILENYHNPGNNKEYLNQALFLIKSEIEKLKKEANPIHTKRQAARVVIHNEAIDKVIDLFGGEK